MKIVEEIKAVDQKDKRSEAPLPRGAGAALVHRPDRARWGGGSQAKCGKAGPARAGEPGEQPWWATGKELKEMFFFFFF